MFLGPQTPYFGTQKGPKTSFFTENVPEKLPRWGKPYINRFPLSIRIRWYNWHGYQFIIFPYQSYHRILIDSGNQFIYGFQQVCRVFEQLFLKNTIWSHFGTKNAPFLVQFPHLQPFVCNNSTDGDLFCNFMQQLQSTHSFIFTLFFKIAILPLQWSIWGWAHFDPKFFKF